MQQTGMNRIEKKLAFYANAGQCPIRNILDRIGDKWSMLVLLALNDAEVLRFNELHKVIGTISQKMLSATLKSLEADNLLERKLYPVIPPRVEYRLSSRGQSLIPHLEQLVAWADSHYEAIMSARQQHEQAE